MVSYQIEIKPSAAKELEKLPRQVIPRVVTAINKLTENPYPQGIKKLAGFERTYRIRVGDYRVLYDVLDKLLIIEIIRKDAYK
jgi:mRNA interferase RelE/StbE